jgi:hypothetical protein
MHHWLALPASTVPLYVEAMTITRYGQVALSVSAYGFATIAVPLVYFRCAAWRPHRAVAALAVGAVLLAGIAAGTRLMSSRLFPPPSNEAILDRTLDPALVAGADVVVKDAPSNTLPTIEGPATIEGIRARGVICVGYGRNIWGCNRATASAPRRSPIGPRASRAPAPRRAGICSTMC